MRHVSGTVNIVLGGVAVVVIVIVLLLVRHKARRMIDLAEAAYPGPLEAP